MGMAHTLITITCYILLLNFMMLGGYRTILEKKGGVFRKFEFQIGRKVNFRIVKTKFFSDVAPVGLDGVRGHVQPTGNLL